MKHFMIQIPNEVYASDMYANSKKEAIEKYKKQWKLDRMPRGYGIWEK